MEIGELIQSIDNLIITDSDGDTRRVQWNPGMSSSELEKYENQLGYRLPDAYRQFLMHSDGCDLFGLYLQSGRESTHLDGKLLPIHNWGNGDFDCLMLGTDPNSIPVLFMNHNADVTVKVAESFVYWIEAVLHELKAEGTVYHPGDYRFFHGSGVYDHVLKELEGVDCELNR